MRSRADRSAFTGARASARDHGRRAKLPYVMVTVSAFTTHLPDVLWP